MAGLQELFANLGIDPTRRPTGPTTVSEFQAVNPLAREAASRAASLPSPEMPAVSTRNTILSQYGPSAGVGPVDSGGGGFSFRDAIGGAFTKALDIIDTPRAFVVSGLKEYGDIIQGKGASWDDFVKQGWDNIRFGEVLRELDPDAPEWTYKVLGFAGDVGADPLTYLTLGAAKAGVVGTKAVVTPADEALLAAVRSGGREQIGKALWTKAVEAGVQDAPEVQRLVSLAAKRGRGGLTPKALANAGIDDVMRDTLSIPRFTSTVAGKSIPLTGKVANAAEYGKGVVKNALGRRAAAQAWRKIRVTDHNSYRAILDVMRRSDDPEKVAAATGLLAATANAGRMADTQLDGWVRGITNAAKDGDRAILRMDKDQAARLTDLIETGAQDDAATVFRDTFAKVKQTLADAGVDIGNIDDYVSHIPTDAARKAARGDARVASILKDINSRSFFENARTLNAEDDFLGETLEFGTIREINEISQRELGFKFFEDDIRDIMAVYLGSARESLYRGNLKTMLEKFGIDRPMKFTNELSDAEKKLYDQILADAKAAGKDRTVALKNGTKVRVDMANTQLKAIRGRQKQLTKMVDDIRQQLGTISRQHTDLSVKVAGLEDAVAGFEQSVAQWRKVATTERGAARRKALAEVSKAEQRLLGKQAELDAARGALKEFEDSFSMVPRARGSAARANYEQMVTSQTSAIDDIVAQLDAAKAELDVLAADADALLVARNAIGDIPTGSELTYKAQQTLLDDFRKSLKTAGAEAADVRVLLADTEWVLDALQQQKQLFDDLADNPKWIRKLRAANADPDLVRQQVQDVTNIFSRQGEEVLLADGTPALKLLYDQEATAHAYELAAEVAGKKQADLLSMAEVMEQPGFGANIRNELSKGYVQIGEGREIPGWIDELLKIETKISDPSHFPNAAKFIREFENVWKGWAVGRPGFFVRNAYSSLYSMYLEAGAQSIGSVRKFSKFIKMYAKDPENYMDTATKAFGVSDANRLNDALSAVFASGSGEVAAEVSSQLLRGMTLNPLSTRFPLVKGIRKINEDIEAVIRGSHAYDVLRRGGSADLAVDTLNKWHFNYRDITSFDRALKHVNPFWTFWSRNMALQAYVWSHKLPQLNRTYMNLRANLQLGQPEEEGMPSWLAAQMPLAVSVDPTGTSRYATPGLPSFQFISDVQNLTNPKRTLSQTSPLVQLPLQGLIGENLFTGREYTGYRDAGVWGPLTGVVGLSERTGSGGQAVTPYTYDILNSLFPISGTVSKGLGFDENTDPLWSWLGWAGLSTQEVNAQRRASQRRSEAYRETAAQLKQQMLREM